MERGCAFRGFRPYHDNRACRYEWRPLYKACLFPLLFTTHQEPGESTSTLHHQTGEIEEDLATSTRLQEMPKPYKNITESNSKTLYYAYLVFCTKIVWAPESDRLQSAKSARLLCCRTCCQRLFIIAPFRNELPKTLICILHVRGKSGWLISPVLIP
jgi:hypothetical protein